RWLASASWDGTARVWDVEFGIENTVCGTHRGWVTAVACTPDGWTWITGGTDREVVLWAGPLGLSPDGPRASLETPTSRVGAVAVAPDGATVAASGGDGIIRFWDIASCQPRGVIGRSPTSDFWKKKG